MIKTLIKHRQFNNLTKNVSFSVTKVLNQHNSCNFLRHPNLTFSRCRFLHLSAKNTNKLYVDNENLYVYKLLNTQTDEQPQFQETSPINNIEEFEKVLSGDFRSSNIEKVVSTFTQVLNIARDEKIALSDKRFDNLVDGLMDHCQNLSDNQLFSLLQTLKQFPECDSHDSHNFHDVWSCLDDICCWKMSQFSLERKIQFGFLWYELHLAKLSDYIFELINYLPQRAHKLTKKQLLQVYFLLNACRKKTVEFEFEHALSNLIHECSVDEMGLVAMAYFKSKTKIKLVNILTEMIRKVSENSGNINEITLSAILKTVRFSQKHETIEEIEVMLEKLLPEIPRLSVEACLHVALIGTTIQYKHEATLRASSLRLIANFEKIRLKEIERILLVNSMFDFSPSSDVNLYDLALAELEKSSRLPEIVKFNRSLPWALNYLSLQEKYSFGLLDRVLNEDFVHEVYGKSPRLLPRELFSLDRSIEIECEGYSGSRLSLPKVYKAAKWLTDFVPTRDQYQRLTLADRFFLDVVEVTAEIVGSEKVCQDHILPHFSRPDIVLCRERASGEFVEVFGFENYILGDVKRALEVERFEWIVFVLLVPNSVVRGSDQPLGAMKMKERQLKKIGFNPTFISSMEFAGMSNLEKKELIKERILRLG